MPNTFQAITKAGFIGAAMVLIMGVTLTYLGQPLLGASVSLALMILLILACTELYKAQEEYELLNDQRSLIMLSIEKFQEDAATCSNFTEVDELAMRWLRSVCKDHGKGGQHAKKLLDIVGELLDISP